MVGFEDNYNLYMGGEELQKGAYVEVSLFGNASSEAYSKMTAERFAEYMRRSFLYREELIYVTYHGVKDWGWDGRNF